MAHHLAEVITKVKYAGGGCYHGKMDMMGFYKLSRPGLFDIQEEALCINHSIGKGASASG